MKKDFTKLLIGLIIMALGISLLFNQLGLESVFGFSFGFMLSILWPLIVIVIGLSIWLSGKNVAGLVISAIGLFFLLNVAFKINLWTLIWPLGLIILGFMILFKGSLKSTKDKTSEEFISINGIFTGLEKKVISKNFKGGNVFVIFGGCDIDLREAGLDKNGAKLEITTLFGGTKVMVPKKVRVLSEGSALFGGWENKAESIADEKAPLLKINGTAVFGGVEIK